MMHLAFKNWCTVQTTVLSACFVIVGLLPIILPRFIETGGLVALAFFSALGWSFWWIRERNKAVWHPTTVFLVLTTGVSLVSSLWTRGDFYSWVGFGGMESQSVIFIALLASFIFLFSQQQHHSLAKMFLWTLTVSVLLFHLIYWILAIRHQLPTTWAFLDIQLFWIGAALMWIHGVDLWQSKHVQTFWTWMAVFVLTLSTLIFAVWQILPQLDAVKPLSVRPSVQESIRIVQQAFTKQGGWLLGTGPGTYHLAYQRARIPEINLSPFWNIRFTQAHDTWLTGLTTHGLIGFLLVICWFTWMIKSRRDIAWFGATCILALSLAFSQESITLILMLMITSVIATQPFSLPHSTGVSRPWMVVSKQAIGALTVVSVWIFVLFLGIWGYAEYAFLRLERTNLPTSVIYERLLRITSWNPYHPNYTRNLAQAAIAQLAQASRKTDAASSEPARDIQTWTTTAISAAKTTTKLSLSDALGWRIQGAVYRELMPFVEGAETFALRAYETADHYEPFQPIHAIGRGRVYLYKARFLEQQPTANPEAIETSYRQAQVAFREALALRPNDPTAGTLLALLLERQGQRVLAIEQLERTLRMASEHTDAHWLLSLLYWRQDETGRAIQELERAIYFAPTQLSFRWVLALMYEAVGEKTKAIEVLTLLEQLQPQQAIVFAKRREQIQANIRDSATISLLHSDALYESIE